jgi:HPr kinase/phosphorylase
MICHASCVAFDGSAILIQGASGSGKSGLALQLMGLGAELVADDRTEIALRDGWPWATAPASIQGLIEARGIGILQAPHIAAARLHLVVDMDVLETERLPHNRATAVLGQPLPLLHKVESAYFAAALRQYLLAGKADI